MATQRTQLSNTRNDLRDTVFTVCSIAGMLVGVPWAIQSTGEMAPCGGVAACVGQAIVEIVLPALIRVGLGVGAGALVALVVVTAVPGLRRR